MSILKIKDGNGNWIDILAVAGLSPTVSVQNIQGGHETTEYVTIQSVTGDLIITATAM